MNRTLLIASASIVLLLGGIGALFVLQNSSRTTGLSLDLGFMAAQLQEPVSIPALMGICALAGAVLVGLPLFVRSLRLSGEVKRLRQQASLADVQSEWR